MVTVDAALRKEIARQGLTNVEFAKKWKLSNGTLYSLLNGAPVGSLRTAQRLIEAGVKLPQRELLSA